MAPRSAPSSRRRAAKDKRPNWLETPASYHAIKQSDS
jgi:hypothetical protein